MLFSFVGRFPDHRPKRIIGDWHATMFAAARIDESAPASEVPVWGRGSEALRRLARQLRHMFAAGFDVPAFVLRVRPDALPRRPLATVVSLQLSGLHHPEAPTRLRAEGRNEVAGFGHTVHSATVDPGQVHPRAVVPLWPAVLNEAELAHG